MKKSKRLLALLLGLALCGSMLTACQKNNGGNKPAEDDKTSESDANTDTDKKEEDSSSAEGGDGTLVVSATGFENKFSPFFSQNVDDVTIGADMTQLMLMYVDRVSEPILNGIDGEKREYNGTEYTYYGPSNITVTENEDGTVVYEVKMRDDLVFSDGTPVDIDDAIFSLYVYMDPSYDGSTTMYSTPIKGLEAYRSGMETLFNLLVKAGRDNTDFTNWDEATQTAFWESLDKAGAAFAQEIVDYCVAAGECAEG